jgi:hypothetical protein
MQRLPIAIEDALTAFVQSVQTDATVIWAKPEGPRPKRPFIVLDIISGPTRIGNAEQRYKDEDTFVYGIRKKGTLNVRIYAANALVRSGIIDDALQLPSRLETLLAAGIAVWGSDGPHDITELLDTAFEPRAGLDIFLSWPVPAEDTPGEIHSVRVIGSADDITVDKTIDIEEE